MMNTSVEAPWYIEWSWVSGYSSISTLVIVFNLPIIFSVINNKFLHYSFNYVVVALSLRNILRVIFTLFLVFLAKVIQTPSLVRETLLLPANMSIKDIDLTQSANMLLTCKVLSMSDHLLMTILMFYFASLSVYLFCRHPNPPVSVASKTMLKVHGIAPVKERVWVSPLLLLLPLLLSSLICLPVPLMLETHAMVALPGGSLCKIPDKMKFSTYQFSVAIIGFYLPAAIVIFLVLGLSIRRCISCSAGPCVSSFCKEEIALALVTLTYIPTYLAMYLPLLDNYLQKLEISPTNLQQFITPEVARAAEMSMGLVLPGIIFTLIKPYRRFTTNPDESDVRRIRRNMVSAQPSAPDNRLSDASFDLDLSHRNSYYYH